MSKAAKSDSRRARIARQSGGENGLGTGVVTKEELAAALKLSLRTVERMLGNEDITPLELPGRVVRFYLPDVIEELRQGKHKFGRRAATETVGPRTIDYGPGAKRGREFEEGFEQEATEGGPENSQSPIANSQPPIVNSQSPIANSQCGFSDLRFQSREEAQGAEKE